MKTISFILALVALPAVAVAAPASELNHNHQAPTAKPAPAPAPTPAPTVATSGVKPTAPAGETTPPATSGDKKIDGIADNPLDVRPSFVDAANKASKLGKKA